LSWLGKAWAAAGAAERVVEMAAAAMAAAAMEVATGVAVTEVVVLAAEMAAAMVAAAKAGVETEAVTAEEATVVAARAVETVEAAKAVAMAELRSPHLRNSVLRASRPPSRKWDSNQCRLSQRLSLGPSPLSQDGIGNASRLQELDPLQDCLST